MFQRGDIGVSVRSRAGTIRTLFLEIGPQLGS